MRLKGKVAVVTGGARDIGRAISVKLAKEGAKVAVNYFNSEEDADETLKLIKAAGGEAIKVYGDMTKEKDVKNLFAETVKAFGNKIDILVNNVGGLVGRKNLLEQDEGWYDTLMDLNFKSTYMTTKEVVPLMKDGGAIVNSGSQAGRDGGGPGSSLYATSKAAVMCFTRAMAKELGPKGIRVNSVAPGMIDTLFHDTFTAPEARKNLENSSPLRRQGQPEDVANLVCYLASEESAYLTGTNIDINGGMLFS